MLMRRVRTKDRDAQKIKKRGLNQKKRTHSKKTVINQIARRKESSSSKE